MANAKRGRVLVVTSSVARWPGDATSPFILRLAEDLQALGWRMDILAPHTRGAAIRDSINGIRIERFRYLWPASAQTLCYGSGALLNLRRRRLNALKVPMLVFFQCLGIAWRLLGRRYDLVHSHWILPQAFAAALSTVPLRIPHVVTVHGSDVFSLRGAVLAVFKTAALKAADAVTVNSMATGAAITRIVATLPEVHRIPMGASASSQSLPVVDELRRRFRRGDGPLLVFVGRLIEEKGVTDLLQAVQLLAPRLPTTTAVVIGDGQDRPIMQGLANDLAIADRVVFTGSIPPDEIPSYLAAADVFVGPSKRGPNGSSEGQGLTFIEAMLARTPVVATRVGGIIDAVQHERTGLLVAENAPSEIADAVERLARDPALAARLRDGAFELACHNFTREAAAYAFSQLFEKVISARR